MVPSGMNLVAQVILGRDLAFGQLLPDGPQSTETSQDHTFGSGGARSPKRKELAQPPSQPTTRPYTE